MSKLEPIEDREGVVVAYLFDCPGCGNSHNPYVRPNKAPNGASWDFNENLEFPTFTPSILSRIERADGKNQICHLYVTNGQIRFLVDCTHSLAGQIVDMVDVYSVE